MFAGWYDRIAMDPEAVLYGWIVLCAAACAVYLALKVFVLRRCPLCGHRSVLFGRCLKCQKIER